jgi:hypothetical protein
MAASNLRHPSLSVVAALSRESVMRKGSLEEFDREELIQRVLILERENTYLAKQATEMAVRLGELQIREERSALRQQKAVS